MTEAASKAQTIAATHALHAFSTPTGGEGGREMNSDGKGRGGGGRGGGLREGRRLERGGMANWFIVGLRLKTEGQMGTPGRPISEWESGSAKLRISQNFYSIAAFPLTVFRKIKAIY